MFMRKRSPFLLGAVIALAASCSPDGAESQAPAAAPTCAAGLEPVERFKELLVVDDAVIGDARARNAEAGPWSFRHLVEAMAPAGQTPSAFVLAWLSTWEKTTTVNQFPVAARPLMREVVICPWLRATPANGCNDDCSSCAQQELDLGLAPFRLVGIVNRIDLRYRTYRSEAGEGRLVFGVTRGPGDDPASEPLLMTVGFEYNLPLSDGRTAGSWAARWHALGALPDYGPDYLAALQAITDEFTARGAEPGSPGGSALRQLRTNEREFDWLWELRQYELGERGLTLAPLPNTPDRSENGSAELTRFVTQNREAVLAGTHELTPALAAGAAHPSSPWVVPGASEPLRQAFARQTCDGCHQSEAVPVDFNFHLSPFRRGVDKVSPFLNNPADPSGDELEQRTALLRQALCAP